MSAIAFHEKAGQPAPPPVASYELLATGLFEARSLKFAAQEHAI